MCLAPTRLQNTSQECWLLQCLKKWGPLLIPFHNRDIVNNYLQVACRANKEGLDGRQLGQWYRLLPAIQRPKPRGYHLKAGKDYRETPPAPSEARLSRQRAA